MGTGRGAMKRDYTFVVVGLGGIGSAAAYWLARRAGSEVLGLEQFEIGHDRGASQDHSRIIRLSYHTPGHVMLARSAYDAWRAVEAEAGDRFVVTTGGLDLGPESSPIPLSDYAKSMEACGVPFEWLDAGEVMTRWPSWRVPDDVHALFQPDGGFVTAARANRAHVRLARGHGAVLRDRSPVRSIRPADGEVEVVAGGVSYRCETLVIAADAWINQLLANLDARVPLTMTQEQVTYFRAPDPEAFVPERFPVWIWLDDPCFYGLPMFGEAGPKVAQDVGGDEISIESRTFEPNPETHRRVTGFMARYLPAALGPEILTKTCQYTMPPDREFVIGPVPGHPNVLVALGAAHGYKFASLFGKILSELACDGETEHDISRFGMDRAALAGPESPRRFLF